MIFWVFGKIGRSKKGPHYGAENFHTGALHICALKIRAPDAEKYVRGLSTILRVFEKIQNFRNVTHYGAEK